jgi:voltage-gated potassium channel Kch
MIGALLLGAMALAISMVIQVTAVVLMLRGLTRRIAAGRIRSGFSSDAGVLLAVLFVLATGHVIQIAIWALLFIQIGEFGDFATAFYHSTVNFATLGYGDIVMTERWRLLGAFEAASGVLMFGLSTGTLFAAMSHIFRRGRMMAETNP